MSFQSVKVASGRKTYNIIKSEVVENAHQILLKRSKLFNRYLYYFEDRGKTWLNQQSSILKHWF